MKSMIYALTRQQVREKNSGVTRRVGCLRLKYGEWSYRIMKCLGFRTEERFKKIGSAVIIVLNLGKPFRSECQQLAAAALVHANCAEVNTITEQRWRQA